MKVTLDIDLEKFRGSLIGDGCCIEQVKSLTNEMLISTLNNRVENFINLGYTKAKRMGWLKFLYEE